MTFNLGLDKTNKANSMEELEDELLMAVVDDDADISDVNDGICNLIKIDKALRDVNYSDDAVQVLSRDPIFKSIVDSDLDPARAIARFIKKSEENLLQDFLMWGPFVIITRYLRSIKRLRKILNRVVIGQKDLTENRFDQELFLGNIYLPKYQEVLLAFKGMDVMHKGILACHRNPKLDIKPLISSLRACGYKVTEESVVQNKYTVDWGAVVGSTIGWAITLLTGGFGAPFGLIVGGPVAHSLSKNAGSLYDKGYNKQRFVSCCREMLIKIDKLSELEGKSAATLQTLGDDPEARGKVRFIKSVTKQYVKAIKNLGLGLTRGYTIARKDPLEKIFDKDVR